MISKETALLALAVLEADDPEIPAAIFSDWWLDHKEEVEELIKTKHDEIIRCRCVSFLQGKPVKVSWRKGTTWKYLIRGYRRSKNGKRTGLHSFDTLKRKCKEIIGESVEIAS